MTKWIVVIQSVIREGVALHSIEFDDEIAASDAYEHLMLKGKSMEIFMFPKGQPEEMNGRSK